MRPHRLLLCAAFLALVLPPALPSPSSAAYFDDDGEMLEDYSDNEIESILEAAQKRGSRIYLYRRGCVRRGGGCDHRPSDCCANSTCRCNLWGANCRCQRKGLFQKWGRK